MLEGPRCRLRPPNMVPQASSLGVGPGVGGVSGGGGEYRSLGRVSCVSNGVRTVPLASVAGLLAALRVRFENIGRPSKWWDRTGPEGRGLASGPVFGAETEKVRGGEGPRFGGRRNVRRRRWVCAPTPDVLVLTPDG